MDRAAVRAPAKINLALTVAPPRQADGLHPICSWFVPVDLADDLVVERLAPGRPSRYDITWAADAPRPTPIDWTIEKDLAVRAHRLLETEVGRALPVSLRLAKRIPVGGGLGGGSSDAAAMLRALVSLFEAPIAAERLRALALRLGSDVPFFLQNPPSPAIVEGVGESITPTPRVEGRVVLIVPPFGCATGAVYKAFDARPPGPFRAADVHRMATSGRIDGAPLFNDLAPAAEAVEPRLAEARQRAEAAIAGRIHLTGSGSTLFVPCGGAAEQTRLVERLRAALPLIPLVVARLDDAAPND